ncbi:sigma-70 family RNA polymerase sigma factor [Candidatus Poribacteria bacterium]|nr:sigma-70 family RNA polymerase sigma factor [Candidatus Poribacteria bacterium]
MKKSDSELVKDALQGDQNAFGELVKRYQTVVYGYAYHLLNSFDEAEELCQEVFIQAYTSLANLKETEKFPSWLRSITRNICVSFIRQKERLRSLEESVPKREILTPEEQYERRELSSQLMEAVKALSERNRLLVTLFYLDGLSYKEIGDFLEVPLNTVKVTLRRARNQLKERLIQMAEEGFKQHKLSSEFVKKVSRAIEERKNITLLGVKVHNGDEEKFSNLLQEATQRYGGVSAKCIGEAHLLLFGIPTMHEDDVERAILCAIFLQEKLKEIGYFSFKAGINTGLGEIYEQTRVSPSPSMEGERRKAEGGRKKGLLTSDFQLPTSIPPEEGEEGYAEGLPSNRAKGEINYVPLGNVLTFTLDLIELADEQILTSESIYRLTYGRFLFRKLERAKDEPTVYEVLGIPEHPRKLWEGHGFTSQMIGREGEFAKLKRAIEELKSGRGRIISVIGEAGIGKSRLVSELKAALTPGPSPIGRGEVLWLEGRCVSYGKQMNYFPFLEILRTYFDIKGTDDDPTVADKISTEVCNLGLDSEIVPYLAGLLSVDLESKEMMHLTAEQLRYKTFVSLRALLRRAAETQPLVIAIEDMHWMDDASYDLLSFLLESVKKVPILFLCVYRPERDEHCFELRQTASTKYPDDYDEVALWGLPSEASGRLIRTILNPNTLPSKVEERIIEKAEGNPLFLFEILKSLVDSGKLVRVEEMSLRAKRSNQWELFGEVEAIEVPDTIHSVIMSRIDRLETGAKQTLQCASVIGDTFEHKLLKSLCDDTDLERHLAQLKNFDFISMGSEVLRESEAPAEPLLSKGSAGASPSRVKGASSALVKGAWRDYEYSFKHALVRDVAISSLLPEKKREYHQKIGEAIERFYPDRIDEYYELLAHHYESSTDFPKALEYLIKAGDKSKALYSNQQAIDYYTKAMALIKQLPEERTEQELSILDGLGDVYHLMGKCDEAIQSYESALKYSEDRKRRADIYRKIARVYSYPSKLQLDLALKYIDTAIDELGQDTHSVEMARVCNEAMATFFFPNRPGYDLDKALDYGFRSLDIVEGTEHKRELEEVCCTLGRIHAWRGDSDKAIQYLQRGLSISQEIGDANLMASAHRSAGFVHQFTNWRTAVEHYKEGIKLCEKIGNIQLMALCHNWLGIAYYWRAKDSESAIKCFKKGIELDRERKFPFNTGFMFNRLSEIYRDKGEWDEAIKHAQEALRIGTTIGRDDLFLASEPCQVLMEAYLAKGELDKALGYCKKGVNLSIHKSSVITLVNFLGFVEDILYQKTGNSAEFISFCHEIMEENAEKLKGIKLTQWYLTPRELSGQFVQTVFSDEFDGSTLCPEWQWVNPRGNCSYELLSEPSLHGVYPRAKRRVRGHAWLEVRAVSGCKLDRGNNFNAPRLLQEISGDFAIETKMASAANSATEAMPTVEDMPTVGGLLVWKDENNHIRFEKGMHGMQGKNEIGLSGSVEGKWDYFGRGMLVSESIYLRMERMGDKFSAYCSSDSENWLICGEVSFPAKEPIQIGIHATGGWCLWGDMADTAARFDYFRVLRRHLS